MDDRKRPLNGRTEHAEQPLHPRRSATPPPGRARDSKPRPFGQRQPPPRPTTYLEFLNGLLDEVIGNPVCLVAGIVVLFAGLGLMLHASSAYASLPPDIEKRVSVIGRSQAGESMEVVGARYGLYSALRCPSWEASSFRLQGKSRADEPAQELILCCTAQPTPVCQGLKSE